MTRSFFYYFGHSFINCFKKLFKTWVAWFLLALIAMYALMMAGGFLLGTLIGNVIPDDQPEDTGSEIIEPIDVPIDPDDGESEMTEEDVARAQAIAELVCGAAVAIGIVFASLIANKSASNIFFLADVNTLFSAPVKPQSNLLFRMILQLGTVILASCIMFINVPTYIELFDISAFAIVSFVILWVFLLTSCMVFSIFNNIIISAHPKSKRLVEWLPTALVCAAVAGYIYYFKTSDMSAFDAAVSFFNADFTRYIPIWGWMKAIPLYALEGNIPGFVIAILVNIAVIVVIFILAWRMNADFYEDALEGAAKRQAAIDKSRGSKAGLFSSDDKPKKHKKGDAKDLVIKGSGASAFFSKNFRVRRRSSTLGFLNFRSIVFIILASGAAAITKFAFDGTTVLPVVIIAGVMIFFSSMLGLNLIDPSRDLFYLAPVSPVKLSWACLMSETLNAFIDYMPGLIIAECLLLDSPILVIGYALIVFTMSFLCNGASFFADMILPSSLHPSIRAIMQIVILLALCMPCLIPVIIFIVIGLEEVGVFVLAALNFAIGTLLACLAPLGFRNGRK